MQQVAEYYGLRPDRSGLCLCPFHKDRHPSLKIYPNGKGFYCFTCGTGGDQIKFAALYLGVKNQEAAKELAAAFHVPVEEPSTYREKREAELAVRRRREFSAWVKRSRMYLTAYLGLLYEAAREPGGLRFEEGLKNMSYVEYLLDCLEQCPEDVYADKRAVRKIGAVEGRIADWYERTPEDGAIPG